MMLVPPPVVPAYLGPLLPSAVQEKCLSLILKNEGDVISKTLENDRRNREEKREWVREDRARARLKRPRDTKPMQSSFLNRKVAKIHRGCYT